jgi:PIN domain nuclease of toxin-antitoxin system
MKLLLDTVTFLQAAAEPEQLSSRARNLLMDPENERYLSTVSSWEIVIKYSLKKLRLEQPPERFILEQRLKLSAEALDLDEESALHLARLPLLHKDPFDRMLICQAIIHGMVLLTPDVNISKYPVRTAW